MDNKMQEFKEHLAAVMSKARLKRKRYRKVPGYESPSMLRRKSYGKRGAIKAIDFVLWRTGGFVFQKVYGEPSKEPYGHTALSEICGMQQ